MSERFFEYDQVTIDASKIEEYEHDVFGPVTVFKDVVIAREIVQPYVIDGETKMAYKPAKELEDSYWTAEGMWAIASGHPDTAIIMDRDQMQGRTVNVRFTKGLMDKTRRPKARGILADLEVFNSKVAPEVLDDMKTGERHDVSIGFFFSMDKTPGVIEEDGHPLKGTTYDYVQRKMAINHTAFALEAGRCPMPFCGIGADEIAMHIAGDPFAGYKNFAECIKKNKDKDDPAAYCGAIKAKVEEKKDVFKTVLENMKKEIDAVLSQFVEIEELKKDEGETIVDEPMSNEEDLSGLLAFYRITVENWGDMLEETKIILRSLYTERSKVYKDKDPAEMAGGEQPLQDPALTGDEVVDDCPDCEDDEEAVKQLAADLSLEEIDKKLNGLKGTREGYRDQIRKLDEELYSEPDSEKKRKEALRKEIGELWDKIDSLYDEIRAYTQAKTIKITQAALADESEKKKDDTPEDDTKQPVEKKEFVATKSVEELLRRQR